MFALIGSVIFVAGFFLGIFSVQNPNLRVQRLVSIINLQQIDLVNDAETHLTLWSRELAQHGNLLDSPCDSEVIKAIDGDTRFTTYGIAEPDGDVICTKVEPQSNVNIADRPYFQKVLETKELGMSGFQVGRITGSSVVAYAYPVFDSQGEVRQVVFLGIDLGWMNDLFEQLNLPHGSELVISDPEGHVEVYYPRNDELIGKQAFDIKIFSIMFSEQSGQLKLEGVDGTTRKYVYGPVYLDKDEMPDAFLLYGLPRWPIIEVSPAMLAISMVVGLFAVSVQALILKRISRKV